MDTTEKKKRKKIEWKRPEISSRKLNIPKESLRHRYQDIKRIRDIKGNFHAKMGTIKDRNGMDLTEADDIKKRWQE